MKPKVPEYEFEARIANIEDNITTLAKVLDKLTKILADNTATLKNIQATQDCQTRCLEETRNALKTIPLDRQREDKQA